MNVSFGNLATLRPGVIEPNAKEKVSELMDKLHEAGFVREEITDKNANQDEGVKSYHIYDLPYKIEFSTRDAALEASEIMTPYSKYLAPVSVVG